MYRSSFIKTLLLSFLIIFLFQFLISNLQSPIHAQLIDTENYDGGSVGGVTTVTDFKKNSDGTYSYEINFKANTTVNIEPAECEFLDRIQFTTQKDLKATLVIKKYKVDELDDSIKGKIYEVCEAKFLENIGSDEIKDITFRTVITKDWIETNKLADDKVSLYRIKKIDDKDVTKIETTLFTKTRSNVFFESEPNTIGATYFIGEVSGEIAVEQPKTDEPATDNTEKKDISQYLFLIPACCALILLVLLFLLAVLSRRRRRDEQQMTEYNYNADLSATDNVPNTYSTVDPYNQPYPPAQG